LAYAEWVNALNRTRTTSTRGSGSGSFTRPAGRDHDVSPVVSDCDGTGLLSQSTDDFTITASNTFVCPEAANSFARCYVFADEGCTSDRIVTGARIGIEFINGAMEFDVTVNLYTSVGCLSGTPGAPGVPGRTEVLRASTPFRVTAAMAGTIQNVPLDTMGFVADANEALLIEIDHPAVPGASFFPGSNPNGESAPSYTFAAACGDSNYVTFNSLGFPQVDLILGLTTDSAPTAAPTSSPTAAPTAPTSSPTAAPTAAPTSESPTPAPSNVCDQACKGNADKTPMFLTKLGQCKSACVPDALVARKQKFGWLCGVCP
jgi:cell division septation protein DedD